jgi:hypothetical protein
MSKKHIPTVWKWLDEIVYFKTPVEDISEESWDNWNSYTVNRSISMNQNFIELVNFVQTVPYDQKKQIYSIYKEMIPKRKMFFKWIKSNTKKKPTTLVEYVAKYFECGLGEAEEYIDILREHGVRSILYEMGVDEKEQKKLLK